jgi:hypothetical protein
VRSRTEKAIGTGALIGSVLLVIIVLVTAAALFSRPAMTWLRAKLGWAPAAAATAYTVGEPSGVPVAWHIDTPYTLILFARSTCAACERSKPLHQRLITDNASRADLRVMLATPDPLARELDYGRALGLADARVIHIETPTVKVKTVPTLLLVNRYGVVVATREGVLDDAEQLLFRDLIAKLK